MSARAMARRAAGCVRRLAWCLANDFMLTLELAAWRIALPGLKRIVGLNTLTRFMWSARGERIAPDRRQAELQRMNRMISSGGRLLVSSNCLERSLMLYRLFSRAGAEPSLVLGTAVGEPSVDGHVWVELDGVAVGEPDRARYTSLVSFTRHGRACPSAGLRAHA